MDPLDIVLIEDGRHGPDGLERSADLLEQRLFEHAGQIRGLVRIFFEDVPCADDEVFDRGERNEILDQRRAALGALAQPYGGELRQRTDGLRQSPFHGFQPGDERGGHRAHAGNEHAEFSAGGRDTNALLFRHDANLPGEKR